MPCLVSGTESHTYIFDSELPSDWWITNGDAAVQNGYLTATECLDPLSNGFCTVSLWSNSSITVGSWMLDYFRAEKNNDMLFYFMAQGISNISQNHWPEEANCLFILGEDSAKEGNIAFGDFFEGDGNVPNHRDNFNINDLSLSWIHIEVSRSLDGILSLSINNQFLGNVSSEISESVTINLQIGIGDRIDNFIITDELSDTIDTTVQGSLTSTPDQVVGSEPVNSAQSKNKLTINDNLRYICAIIGGSLASWFAVSYGITRYRIRKNFQNLKYLHIIQSSAKMPELTSSMIFTLMGTSNNSRDNNEYNIPSELLNYRYLMHPIRLAILKILVQEIQMPANEIREILGLKPSEFRNHLISLEERGYLTLEDRFNPHGTVFRYALIEDHGKQEFQKLFELLREFMKEDSPFQAILNTDIEKKYFDSFYPTE